MTDRMKALAEAVFALIEQIEKNDFRDGHGHDLKMLKAYQDLKTLTAAPPLE